VFVLSTKFISKDHVSVKILLEAFGVDKVEFASRRMHQDFFESDELAVGSPHEAHPLILEVKVIDVVWVMFSSEQILLVLFYVLSIYISDYNNRRYQRRAVMKLEKQ